METRRGEQVHDRQGLNQEISPGEKAGELYMLQKSIWPRVSEEDLIKKRLGDWLRLGGTDESDELKEDR